MPNGLPPATRFSTAEAAAQITRTNEHWGPALGQPATVTYAFRAAVPDGYQMDPDSLEGNSFLRLNGGQVSAVRTALQLWSDVADITFTYVRDPASSYSNNASMLFGTYLSTTDNSSGFARGPGSTDAASNDGDVWLNRNVFMGNGSIGPGQGTFDTIIHEIGHAIGLEHPGNYNVVAGAGAVQPAYLNDALYVEDHRQYTIMSYFTLGAARAIESPLLHDIAAAQRLYGANLDTRLGNDVYGFNSTVRGPSAPVFDFNINFAPHIAIYDAGGNDTFDVSGWGNDQIIDLRPEAFSSVGGLVANVAMAALVFDPFRIAVNWIENAVGGSGADTLIGNPVDNLLQGGPGGDSLVGGGGFDLAGYARAAWGVRADLDQPANNGGDADGDSFEGIEGLAGSAFADTLRGDFQANRLLGGDGADSLHGGIGADTLYGEFGNDTLIGAAGPDGLFGGGNVDLASYETALAPVSAWLGIAGPGVGAGQGDAVGDWFVSVEGLRGSAFDDVLSGNAGANRLEGGEGNDLLYGFDGNDTVAGDGGNDTVFAGFGADSVHGGAGVDLVDYGGVTQASRIVLGRDWITAAGTLIVSGGGAAGDRFHDVENVIGTSQDDTIYGNALDNVLIGGLGIDNLRGGAGNDIYEVGARSGTLLLFDSVVEAVDSGFDTVRIAASFQFGSLLASYTLDANVEGLEAQGDGNFTLVGNVLDNRLLGSTGRDRLVAGDGADTLGGGAGSDTLFGEFGDDTYILTDVNPTAFSLAEWDSVLEPVNGGTDRVILAAAPHPSLAFFVASYTLGAEIENGAVYDDRNFTLVGNTKANDLDGGNGDDRLVAGDGGDTIWGALGADTLFGEFGDDTYNLTDVAPTGPLGTNVWDTILEAAPGGTDTVLIERARRDTFFESWRSDHTLADFIENGRVTGDQQFTLTGNVLDNRLTGNGAFNFLVGQDGADTLEGMGGDDALNGGFHNDLLLGGGGADTMDGAAGKDTLVGGADADIFVFSTSPVSAAADTVGGFVAGEDRLLMGLAAFDPGGALGLVAGSLADQAGRFVANAGGLAVGAVAQFTYDTALGRVFFDADGAGGAARQLVVTLGGAPALAASDVFLG